MIVHQTAGLHERIHNRRADKVKPAFFQILAEGVGGGRFDGNLPDIFPGVFNRLAADKTPDVRIEITELLDNFQITFRVLNGRSDLQTVSHDAFVSH